MFRLTYQGCFPKQNGKYFDQKTIIDYLLVLKMDGVFLAGHRGVKKRFSKFLSTTLDDKV